MHKKFHKFKLLLDENMPRRQVLPLLNELFDVKHIRDDLHSGGFSDPQVYILAVKQKRLIVTYNAKDFYDLASRSKESGVIAISPHLSLHQVDTKIASLLLQGSQKALYGTFTVITGGT